MTDEPQPDQPASDAPGDQDVDFASDQDLDDVLAQAAGLAADLSRELGAGEGPSESTDGLPTPGDAENRQTDRDDTPQDIDRPVEASAAELDSAPSGVAESAPSTTEPAPSQDEPVSDSTYTVPEFMDEFTQPEDSPETAPGGSQQRAADSQKPVSKAPAAGTAANEAPRSGASAKPGVVGTGMMGVVGTPSPAPAGDSPTSPPGAPDEEADLASGTPGGGQMVPLLRQAVDRASPLAFSACDRAVSILEAIDRPVAKAGPAVRRAIGWLAIATAATSAVVYLISLL